MLLSFTLRAGVWEVGPGRALSRVQDALRQAQAGDTIRVHPGWYAEGNLIVDKPLVLIGLGFPVLDGQLRHEVLTIKASNVVVRGFQLQNSGTSSTIDMAGIKVLAVDGVILEDNLVYNCNFGIYLSNAQGCRVSCSEIRSTPTIEQNTGNGIHLWKCSAATLNENRIYGHRDGIYFEFVTDSHILNNLSEGNLRYGLHFMFSHNDHYTNNRFFRNGAGVAVMYSHQVNMTANVFEDNWGGSAYGLLLKDITDSRIESNAFIRNTVGIYMEGASRIAIEANHFYNNGWAMRVQASCDANEVHQNIFSGNSFDLSTNGHLVLNNFDGNYWDKYEGYDLNRDGVGDVPFRPVSLYAMVVERMPYGLLLMRSFMVYLMDKAEKVIPSLTPEQLMDKKPAMKSSAM